MTVQQLKQYFECVDESTPIVVQQINDNGDEYDNHVIHHVSIINDKLVIIL